MSDLPKLAAAVGVGSTFYQAGSTPPLKHAKQITNARNWEGGKVPDFDSYVDDEDADDGVGNSDAANFGRTGLPGYIVQTETPRPGDPGAEQTGEQIGSAPANLAGGAVEFDGIRDESGQGAEATAGTPGAGTPATGVTDLTGTDGSTPGGPRKAAKPAKSTAATQQ